MWGVIVTIASLLAATGGFIYIALKLNSSVRNNSNDPYGERAKNDVENLFDAEFREELKNRGRLHFENIISENAMFLQQDLRLTTSQLNEYMKTEITRKLQEEFSKYEETISDAKEIAVESISKTTEAIELQRQQMTQQLATEIATEKQRLTKRFEDNMAEIVNHYVLGAIGNQIDLNDQLEFILAELEENKKFILEDIKSDG